MAIRDDFTAGEVLAAADLNDTFGSRVPFAYGTATPSTTVDGFVWYDENSTPPTAKFWDGSAFENIAAPSGLSIVTPTSIANSGGTATASGGAVTFSGVSSISLNGCFTSDYENYMIILIALGTTPTALNYRMRASGSDNTTSNYATQLLHVDGTSLAGTVAVAQTSGRISSLNTEKSFAEFTVLNPQIAQATTFIGKESSFISVNPPRVGAYATGFTATTQFDGISFITGAGTMTGNIRVYGYQNS